MKITEKSSEKDKIDLLCSYLEDKLKAFKGFLAATRSLHKTIQALDISQIDRLLAQRQECINRIEKLDAQAGKMKDSHFITGDTARPDSKKRSLRPFVEELKQVMRETFTLDRQYVPVIAAHLDNLKGEIVKMQESREALNNYGVYGVNFSKIPRFLDIKE